MATDNVTLNVGTGGDTVRTLADADGNEWQAVVASYATSISAGNNVLQIVDGSHGLPVAVVGTPTVNIAADQAIEVTQSDATQLKATVDIAAGQTIGATQSGTWTVGLSSGQTIAAVTAITDPVAVTQSGDWTFDLDSVAITGAVEVAQDTAENLLATAYQGGTWTVGISAGQTVAATQSGSWSVSLAGTPTVTVAQSTASNLKATVDIASGQSVAATQSGTWEVEIADGQTITQVTAVGSIANPVGIKAGTALIGKASAGLDTSTLYSGTTELTPKFAKIDVSSSGDNQIVAAVTGKKIRVLRWGLTANGTVSAKWRSGSTELTGARPLIQYASAGGSFCPLGLFETASGEALNLNLSGAVAVGGEILYAEV